MGLNTGDAEHVLKLATLAAESAIKKESAAIFARLNEVVDKVLVITTRMETIDPKITSVVKKEIDACAASRLKASKETIKSRSDNTALLIAGAAFVYSVARPWLTGIL